MTSTERRQVFPAKIDQIDALCEFVTAYASEIGMDGEAVYHCRLSVEEICTNIIEHGYGDLYNSGGVIEVVCRATPGFLSITLVDDAPAFDPLSLPEPDPSTPLWERQGGGWGVYFVKKFMDRVTYARHYERNYFTLEKKF
jgi:anti-sigma regulatory factor (Ser/Thr protein kinase)